MSLRPSVRFEVFKRDSFTCVYCGRRSPDVVLEVDHVLAKANGGGDVMDNLVTSCADCNRGKSSRPLDHVQPDAKAKAERLAEHERQIAAYAKWRAAQRDREDAELGQLSEAFGRISGAVFRAKRSDGGDGERWFWQEVHVRLFLRRIGFHGVLDGIEATSAASWRWSSEAPEERARRAWKYFCGCCWNQIKSPARGEDSS